MSNITVCYTIVLVASKFPNCLVIKLFSLWDVLYWAPDKATILIPRRKLPDAFFLLTPHFNLKSFAVPSPSSPRKRWAPQVGSFQRPFATSIKDRWQCFKLQIRFGKVQQMWFPIHVSLSCLIIIMAAHGVAGRRDYLRTFDNPRNFCKSGRVSRREQPIRILLRKKASS